MVDVVTSVARPTRRTPPSYARLQSQRLFVPWLLVWAVLTWWMWADPRVEVVPYHLIWITFCLGYGFEPWPLRQTVVTLVLATLGSGAVMVAHTRGGSLDTAELAEIPLMLLLCLLVVGHVRRRDAATRRSEVLARRQVADAARRERLARLTSHEMRTPLTIATGYVDLLLEPGPAPDARESDHADLVVVRDELGRLSRACDRLVRMIRLQEPLRTAPVDVDALLDETSRRFSALAERRWVVESTAGTVDGSSERLRACLDTLIENALRYTGTGDTVRLFGLRHADELWIGVADSGPGLSPALADSVNGLGAEASSAPLDERSQTGLGLGLVKEIVAARGGRLHAGTSREGGALLVARLPLRSPGQLPDADAGTPSSG
jgi:signal transduction histidine kinase